MKKSHILSILLVIVIGVTIKQFNGLNKNKSVIEITPFVKEKKTKKLREVAMQNTLERELYEFNLQKNPITGEIPVEEKEQEFENALEAKVNSLFNRNSNNTYISRGPSNLGGRTRAIKIDLSDNTGNTMLAGGVSSGLFRTTNGGASWVKVSANDEIHNVTALAQDPRPAHHNIWYYGTGEWAGNSASLGSAYPGQGVWRSIDNGLTWSQIDLTDSEFIIFDTFLDFINNLEVHPITGDLLIAATGRIYRYDGTNINIELEESSNGLGWTDIEIANDGTVYASLDNSRLATNGIWTSPTNGNGNWTRIAFNGNPAAFGTGGSGRIVLATAPSNSNILYALYNNGNSGNIEADLWRYDASTSIWTDFSSKLPDEPGANLFGNDPFAIQGGYDLVITVRPNDENFLLIGGTNAYKIENITSDNMFSRIGGYINNLSYGTYDIGGVEHHPDIHALEFDPFDSTFKTLISGTDGGVHRTNDVDAQSVVWENLNNNYQTYQFYHVAMHPDPNFNIVVGGAQDNGTKFGGTDAGLPNNTEMNSFAGGDGVAVGIAGRNNNSDLQIIAGTQNGNMFTNFPNFRTTRPSGANSQFVTYFYLDPFNTNMIYYAGLNNLYFNDSAENMTQFNWDNLGSVSTNERIRSVVTTPAPYNPSSSYVYIGGDEGGVFRLLNPQNAFSAAVALNITPNTASTANGTIVSGMAIHPTNPDIMLVVYSNYGINNIFITNNATATSPSWTLVERNLNLHSCRSAAIAEVDGETIYYVGTARGLYSSTDPTTSDWEIEGPNEIGLAVVSSLVYRDSDKKLLVGTHGNGMYETTVQSLSTNTFNKTSLALKVFPNPTTENLKLVSETINLNQTIPFEIYDSNGRQVNKGVISNGIINTSNLSNGFYILNVTINNQAQTIKFVKK